MWKRAERLERAVAQAAMVEEPVAERSATVECPMRTFRSGS
jgi:hypothetical protein